jgi:hypothetical protein
VSPVIILGLVLMWACVLVPMWLRRHDEAQETRSVDRFSTAMHTLSRQDARAAQHYVVMPHRARSLDVHVSGASAEDDASPEAPVVRRRHHRSLPVRLVRAVFILAGGILGALVGVVRFLGSRLVGVMRAGAQRAVHRQRRERRQISAATRRRRTLFGLLLAAVVTLVLAVVAGGVLLWSLQVAVDLAIVGFVRHLRRQVQRAAAVARQRRRAAAAPADVPEVEVEVAVEVAPVPDVVPVVAQAAAVDDGSWEPVPVPRPTYTMKPPAPARPPRSAEYADYSEPIVPAVADDRDELEDTADLGEILDQRWAVND